MSKWIVVDDMLHTKLKELKGTDSFASFINKLVSTEQKQDTIVTLIQKVSVLTERVDRIEKFVSDHSGGEY